MSLAVGFETSAKQTPSQDGALDASLRGIYAEYFTPVWRSLRRLGVHDSDLEDAVQDVFLVLFRRRAEFERRSSLRTWIYGIALRVAKDYRRANKRHDRRVEALGAEPVPSAAAPQPDEEAVRREACRALAAALARLPDEARELIVLVELEQLSVKEAAEALDLHLRACQRRLKKAHEALEAALAQIDQPEWSPNP
jgi:RNA polymerase sigma-70 factor (ECF subfamily)